MIGLVKLFNATEDDLSDMFKALAKRLKSSRDGETKRKILARILNLHYKKNGYGHSLFKRVNVVTDKPVEGEQDGKS
tara:strand:+ start:422 stop:652 length:231 start_codon:yes stop_codon:yes gene_type:complete